MNAWILMFKLGNKTGHVAGSIHRFIDPKRLECGISATRERHSGVQQNRKYGVPLRRNQTSLQLTVSDS